MAQLVKYQLRKQDSVSSDPQNPHMMVIPITQSYVEAETDESMKFIDHLA